MSFLAHHRITWLLEVIRQANGAALQAIEALDGDPLKVDEAVLKTCGDLLSQLLSTLDNSASNPALDGLTGSGAGPVATLNRRLASAYGAAAARVVVNGTSGANLIVGGMVLPMIHGGACKVLCDRDAHLSVAGGLTISGAEAVWLQRTYLPDHDVQAPLTARMIDEHLTADAAIRAVFVTSPTYDGFDVDIEAIADVCRTHGARLVVDGAWGAGYGVLSDVGFPRSPIERGADIAVISIHKKGFAPSQVAVALFRNSADAELFDIAGNIGFATTSPNYVLLTVAESQFADLLSGELSGPWASAIADARSISDQLHRAHPSYRAIQPELVGAKTGDPGHLLIHVGGAGLTGYDLQTALDSYRLTAEKATLDTLLLLIGPAEDDQVEAQLEALRMATRDVLEMVGRSFTSRSSLMRPTHHDEPVMTVRQAMMGRTRLVNIDEAVGEVSASSVAVYPPGSAILVPGEPIRNEQVEYLRAVAAAGGRVRGLDMADARIRVVNTESNIQGG